MSDLTEAHAEIERLRAELAIWKPLTPAAAKKAYDEAEAVPVSKEEIDRIVAFALDPANRCTNSEQAQMVAEIRRLRAHLRAVVADCGRQAMLRGFLSVYGVLNGPLDLFSGPLRVDVVFHLLRPTGDLTWSPTGMRAADVAAAPADVVTLPSFLARSVAFSPDRCVAWGKGRHTLSATGCFR